MRGLPNRRGPGQCQMPEKVAVGVVLAFAPFIAFALIDRLAGSIPGLAAGAAVSAALLIRDWMTPGRAPKILEIGTCVLFCGLTALSLAGGVTSSILGVRLEVDAGLLAIVVVSITIRKPFTLQYARERVAPEYWASPIFVRTNYVITAGWALAFLVVVLADLLLLYGPDMTPAVGIVATIAALVAAIRFTDWYPKHVRDRMSR